jgi:hypothetical protein
MKPETAERIRRDVAMTNSHRESPQDVTDPRPTQQRGPAPAVPVSALRALLEQWKTRKFEIDGDQSPGCYERARIVECSKELAALCHAAEQP